MDSATKSSTWADYRRRVWAFRGLLGLGFVAALYIGARYLVGRIGVHGLLWPLLTWVALVVLAGRRLQDFRCPRCARNFFRSNPRC